MSVPTSFTALGIYFLFHGFFLDIIVIGLIPLLSATAAEASRKALFPWCRGGYPGFGADEVPNLAPTHRRFIAENAAYAILRGGPGLYILSGMGPASLPVMVLAVVSYAAEGFTIANEIFNYGAPADAAPPMTLMGIFSTWTMITVLNNEGNYLGSSPDKAQVNAIIAFVAITWLCWLYGVIGIIRGKNVADDQEKPLLE